MLGILAESGASRARFAAGLPELFAQGSHSTRKLRFASLAFNFLIGVGVQLTASLLMRHSLPPPIAGPASGSVSMHGTTHQPLSRTICSAVI